MLTDITLVCGEMEIEAHKIILVSASDYFSAMFTGGMAETDTPRVEIHGIDPLALPILVDFCYTGNIYYAIHISILGPCKCAVDIVDFCHFSKESISKDFFVAQNCIKIYIMYLYFT